jgi:hypothetical protein
MEIIQALYDQNKSVGLHDVHLPDGWRLNARKVPVPSVPLRGQARRDKIRHRRAILPSDLHEDPTFAMDSEWWDHTAYEPCEAPVGSTRRHRVQLRHISVPAAAGASVGAAAGGRGGGRGGAGAPDGAVPAAELVGGGGPPIEESELVELGN